MPQKNPPKNNNFVIIGSFGTVYGVKGWIKVISFTDPADNITQYEHWYLKLKDRWEPIPIENIKYQHNHLIVKIVDYDNPEEARFFTNKLIGIKRKELPTLVSQEFYWHDLMGLEVKNIQGEALGVVVEILSTGSNDVFVVQDQEGKRHLIPYTEEAVKSIELDRQLMIVDWNSEF